VKFQANEDVEVRSIPWKGIHGKYVRKAFWGHIVEVGDLISGGTPRRVRVGRVRKWQSVWSRA
jgi:hypothetical protein